MDVSNVSSNIAPAGAARKAMSANGMVEGAAGPLTRDDLTMLHQVYGDFGWPESSEGKPIPALALDIASARNIQRAQGLQANLKSTAVETILLNRFDTEHYDTNKLAEVLAYMNEHGADIGISGAAWLKSVNSLTHQPQDSTGTYL